MYISITGLKPKNYLSKIKFWMLAIPSFRAAQKADGNLFCEVREVDGYKHTLTAWKDKNYMMEYIHGITHLKAMRKFSSIATGSTYGFESNEIPSWEKALDLWKTNYKEY